MSNHCTICGNDHRFAATCSYPCFIVIGDKVFYPIPYGYEKDYNPVSPNSSSCPCCNVRVGGVHHKECIIEECPKCHSQLINCNCLKKWGDIDKGGPYNG